MTPAADWEAAAPEAQWRITTMSIFIADLAFTGSFDDLLMAKTGILLASAIAGLGGFIWLLFCPRAGGEASPHY